MALDADKRPVQTMRQLRLLCQHREPDLVILEVPELTAQRLTDEIDLLRGTGIQAPLFVISNGILPGDRPILVTDVVDFATESATSAEIVARVARILEQIKGPPPGTRRVARSPRRTISGLKIDWRRKEASCGKATVKLTTAELLILEALLDRQGETLSTGALLRAVWGEDRYRSESLVPVYIWALRGKLSRLGGTFGIVTMVGSGYKVIRGAGRTSKPKSVGPRNGSARRLA